MRTLTRNQVRSSDLGSRGRRTKWKSTALHCASPCTCWRRAPPFLPVPRGAQLHCCALGYLDNVQGYGDAIRGHVHASVPRDCLMFNVWLFFRCPTTHQVASEREGAMDSGSGECETEEDSAPEASVSPDTPPLLR